MGVLNTAYHRVQAVRSDSHAHRCLPQRWIPTGTNNARCSVSGASNPSLYACPVTRLLQLVVQMGDSGKPSAVSFQVACTLKFVTDQTGVRNQASGGGPGPVVQAGVIDHVSFTESVQASAAHDEPPPRQLPLAVHDFTGRVELLDALDELVEDAISEGGPEAVVISAVDGAAGIGKTTLAVQWAHRAQHRFPDGTLHINLRGYGPGTPAAPGEVLTGFLQALGTVPERIPVGIEAQAAMFRSRLAGRRVLIVLDNANSADQVRPLLPGTPGCAVIVTSRASLTGLVVTEAAHRLTLDLLSPNEARELVVKIVGPERVDVEPGAVNELVRLCGRLPLALRIAAARVTAHPCVTVAEVVSELADDRYRLDVLSQAGDERAAVRAMFDWSYEQLPSESARLFRRLGLHPGPEIGLHAVAAVADMELHQARRVMVDLTAVHLIELVAGSRYRFHDLLRSYAKDQAIRCDSATERAYALNSLLTWYAFTADGCDTLVFRSYPKPPWWLSHRDRPVPIADRSQALDWLNTERTNILAALDYAIRHSLHEHVILLASVIRFLVLKGNWSELLDAWNAGLMAARFVGDRAAESYFCEIGGEAFTMLGRWDEAHSNLNTALEMGRDLGDNLRQVSALTDLGLMCCEQQRFGEALKYLSAALPRSHGVDTGRMEGVIEGNLSRAYSGLGCYREALEHAERGLALRKSAGDLIGEPTALLYIAQARQGLGEHDVAIALCRKGIDLIGDRGERPRLVRLLDTLGSSLSSIGLTLDAEDCWREALVLSDECGTVGETVELRGRLRIAQDEVAES